MGNRNSQSEWCDNELWVNQHLKHLDRNDPQKTFRYVATHHPYMGCAYPTVFPPFSKTMTLHDFAKYADAVTVCCTQVLGNEHDSLTDQQLKMINETAVGNMAYIALHHFNPCTRLHFRQLVDRCRNFMDDE